MRIAYHKKKKEPIVPETEEAQVEPEEAQPDPPPSPEPAAAPLPAPVAPPLPEIIITNPSDKPLVATVGGYVIVLRPGTTTFHCTYMAMDPAQIARTIIRQRPDAGVTYEVKVPVPTATSRQV